MKGICGFCGHYDAPDTIRPALESAIEQLIVNGQAKIFYVGNQGAYDRIVTSILQKLKRKYDEMQYYVVLAYMPGKKRTYAGSVPTLLPEGMELVPGRFAIARRNRWIVEQAAFMIAYVTQDVGGAAQTLAYARQKGVKILNLGKKQEQRPAFPVEVAQER